MMTLFTLFIIGITFLDLIIIHAKLKQIAKAQNETNKALNETRELVAKHQKLLK